MLLSTAVLTTLLVASVTAKPVVDRRKLVKSTLCRRLNTTSAGNLVRHDQARARYFHSRAQALANPLPAVDEYAVSVTLTRSAAVPTATDFNQPIQNAAVIYTATIGVGNPPTDYNLLIDTGSSDTWVDKETYIATKTSITTGEKMKVEYGLGTFSGNLYLDRVTLADGRVVLTNQSIGVGTDSDGLGTGINGILGIGPTELTRGTLFPSEDKTIPTVTDKAFSSHLIKNNQVGIYFEPATKKGTVNGELTWGGFDASKFTGRLNFVPITTTSPSSLFWGINQDITYGKSGARILDTSAGIVDTGTTLILLATDAYKRYVQATGATMDKSVGLLKITRSQFDSLESLFFNINGVSYELIPNAQIWPRSLNSALSGKSDAIYLAVADIGSHADNGIGFILGYTFLERFYTIYDTTNRRIGFATTRFTNATSN